MLTLRELGEMTFSRAGAHLVIVDHTEVDTHDVLSTR